MATVTSTDVHARRGHLPRPLDRDPRLDARCSSSTAPGPGATGTSNWQAVIEELGDRYYCVAPDMIGFGDSTHPENPPSGMKAFNLLQAADAVGAARQPRRAERPPRRQLDGRHDLDPHGARPA